MSDWYLRVLGRPQLVCGDEVLVPWRSGQYWGLLARLVLQRGPVSRALLATSLWPSAGDPRSHLRVALQRLREGLPKGLRIDDLGDGTVVLVPAVGCDLIELRRWMKRADGEANPVQRRHCLEEAALLIRGPFLEGCEAERLEHERQKVRAQFKAILQELQRLQESDGLLQESMATQVLLVSLDREDPPVVRTLLNEVDASRLEECLSVTRLVNSLLAEVGRDLEPILLKLAVFPGRFTVEAAIRIAKATSDILAIFVRNGILRSQDDRFFFSENVRSVLWKRLTSEQRRRMREKHAEYFIEKTLGIDKEVASAYERGGDKDILIASDKWMSFILDTELDCEQALIYAMENRGIRDSSRYFMVVWGSSTSFRRRMVQYVSIIERDLREELQLDTRLQMMATLISACIIDSRFDGYITDFLNWIESSSLHDLSKELIDFCAQVLTQVMIVTHHRGNDELFDRCSDHLMNLHESFGTHFEWHIAAENHRARHRFRDAMICNDEYVDFWKDRDNPGMMGIALLQRGMIFKGLADLDHARQSWNEALHLLERAGNVHEKASCLIALAELYREQNWLSEAKHLAESAVDLFRKVDDQAAVQAACGVLGDIRRDQGYLHEARELYDHALRYWCEQGHERWVTKFRERLEALASYG